MSGYRSCIAAAVLAALVGLGACAGQIREIPGTNKIPDTPQNEEIIKTIERYRVAVEQKNARALMLMASRDYWENSGTPTGADDYGYKGLRKVLAQRLTQAEDIRYSLHYMRIRRRGNRAFVDVLIDASYTIRDALGELERKDKRDQNQFVLEWNGDAWKFVSGM